MESITLQSATKVAGSITLPGSKSISNRALLLAALCEPIKLDDTMTLGTTIRNVLISDDTERMLDALKKLGVQITDGDEKNSYHISGTGGNFPIKETELFLGNAGTAFRPLTAVLSIVNGRYYTLTGVQRMYERPIGDLVNALKQIGAKIEYLGNKGFPPLKIIAPEINIPSPVFIDCSQSSQFLSALLMALPLTKQKVTIEVIGNLISEPYIDITINLMNKFGVSVSRDRAKQNFTIEADESYQSPGEFIVEGDASSASYFLAAGAIAGSVKVIGMGYNSIQGDKLFAAELKKMGVNIDADEQSTKASKSNEKLKAIDLDCNHIPDAAMTLAILALFAEGTTTLRNIASWRVKETDRIAAMATELRKVGATVIEGQDFITITPPEKLTPNAVIDTYDDHRMAMCFSLVCLGGVPITINDPKCVAKTFPDYFEVFKSIIQA